MTVNNFSLISLFSPEIECKPCSAEVEASGVSVWEDLKIWRSFVSQLGGRRSNPGSLLEGTLQVTCGLERAICLLSQPDKRIYAKTLCYYFIVELGHCYVTLLQLWQRLNRLTPTESDRAKLTMKAQCWNKLVQSKSRNDWCKDKNVEKIKKRRKRQRKQNQKKKVPCKLSNMFHVQTWNLSICKEKMSCIINNRKNNFELNKLFLDVGLN